MPFFKTARVSALYGTRFYTAWIRFNPTGAPIDIEAAVNRAAGALDDIVHRIYISTLAQDAETVLQVLRSQAYNLDARTVEVSQGAMTPGFLAEWEDPSAVSIPAPRV